MTLQPLFHVCVPRSSVFDQTLADTVYDLNNLREIDATAFFAENYVTAGMKQLLSEGFKRLAGTSQSASGSFLLSQSMGGGKTHNLLALGLLALYPDMRPDAMGDFAPPGTLGTVNVVAFSGRKMNLSFGLWGEIAEQLHKKPFSITSTARSSRRAMTIGLRSSPASRRLSCSTNCRRISRRHAPYRSARPRWM